MKINKFAILVVTLILTITAQAQQPQSQNSSIQDAINKAKAAGMSQTQINELISSSGGDLSSAIESMQKSTKGSSATSQQYPKTNSSLNSGGYTNPSTLVPSKNGDMRSENIIKIEGLDVDPEMSKTININGYDYEVYDLQNIKKPALIFGRDIFKNKNLDFSPSYNIPTPPSYILGAKDELNIEVWGISEFNSRQMLTPEGTINIEGVGPIELLGLTVNEAERKIKSKVSQIMSGAQVKISLSQIRSIKVNIAGEVLNPGTYTIPSLATLFNAIYSAGGVNDIGSLRNIQVFRNSKLIANLDVYDYILNGKYDANIRLEDNDMIIVSPYESFVNMTGRVKRPMIYEMKKGESILNAIQYAGGFTGDAYNESINVHRKSGRKYSVATVDAPDFAAFSVMDGDSIHIDSVFADYTNRIIIDGAVWRPGQYELSEKISTLSQLIVKAEGLKGDEFGSRGHIMRRKPDYTLEIIPFDVRNAALGNNDILLHPEDNIYIPSILKLREYYTIEVIGEVNTPKIIPFKDGMTVEDVIIMSGGLKESASLAKIDVARRISDSGSKNYTNKVATVHTFEITKDLTVSPEAQRFILKPFDQVYIRPSPGYNEQQQITLTGEVLFPGPYVLELAGERISDIITKSGGLTPEAYAKGASVKRQISAYDKAKLTSLLKIARQSSKSDSASLDSLDFIDEFYPVGIDIANALQNPGCNDDIILQAGDQIIIPKLNNTVKMNGAVLYPNSVTYDTKKLKNYISQAGGYSANARKRPFVIYMNGKVQATKNGFMSKRYPRIEPGCEIIVPVKEKGNSNVLGNTLGVINSSTSLGMMVATMLNIIK